MELGIHTGSSVYAASTFLSSPNTRLAVVNWSSQFIGSKREGGGSFRVTAVPQIDGLYRSLAVEWIHEAIKRKLERNVPYVDVFQPWSEGTQKKKNL